MTGRQKAAARLTSGSSAVAARIGRAVASSSIGVKIGAGLALWKGGPALLAVAHQQPLLPTAAAVGWTWAAWRAGAPTQPATEAPEADGEDADELTGADRLPGFITALHELMDGQTGIHLAQIAAHLFGSEDATAQVRTLAASAGIPITRGVRVKGRGVSTGIKKEDLPPLPSPLSGDPVAVVAAGQASNSNSNTPASNTVARIVTDPDDPHHYTVEWDDQPTHQNA